MLRLAGIGVHAFTASGGVCALFAMLAVLDGRFEQAFAWLIVALVVDAVDGTMARAVDVETHVPRFSGERLDLVVDFLTYVFVPVVALLRGGYLVGWVGQGTAALMLLAALYHFSDLDSKAADKCFVGFPAVWNLVAFCLFAWGATPAMAVVMCLGLVVLAFVPMHWVHPFRVRRFAVPSSVATGAGLAAGVWVLATGFPAGILPSLVLAAASLYFVAMAIAWRWLQ